jgi:hypothetical protein
MERRRDKVDVANVKCGVEDWKLQRHCELAVSEVEAADERKSQATGI